MIAKFCYIIQPYIRLRMAKRTGLKEAGESVPVVDWAKKYGQPDNPRSVESVLEEWSHLSLPESEDEPVKVHESEGEIPSQEEICFEQLRMELVYERGCFFM